jgi:hypothetical protein
MLTNLHWTYAWALWALPLALLPLFNHAARIAYPATSDWPRDLASRVRRCSYVWPEQ